MQVARSQLILAEDPENNLNLHAPLPNRVSIITVRRETGNDEDDAKVVLPTIDSAKIPFADDAKDIAEHRKSQQDNPPLERPPTDESATIAQSATRRDVRVDMQVETAQEDDEEVQQLDENATEMFPAKTEPSKPKATKQKPQPEKNSDEESYRSPMDSPPLRD